MTGLEQFKQIRETVPPEIQSELFKLMTSDPDVALHRMVQLAADQGLCVTSEEVRGFLEKIDDDEEFDDIELDAVALTAIARGSRGRAGNCCQEEAHDEPWGRCPGMRPMRKWLFGRSV